MLDKIYITALQLNKINSFDTKASILYMEVSS